MSDIAEILTGCSSSVDHVLEGCGIEFTVKEMDDGHEIPGSTRNHQQTDIDILLQKGVYPYEYMDSFDRYLETQLPPIEKFHSSLTDERISQKDYQLFAGRPKAALLFWFFVILDVARCYLWLFTLYINIKIGKNSC